jgi:hypothetical protein
MKPFWCVIFCVVSTALAQSVFAQEPSTTITERRLNTLELMLAQGQNRRAEALLSRMIRSASTEETSGPYSALLQQALRDRPFQLNGNFAVLPSTNITRAASATTFSTLIGDFAIGDGGEAQSGLGLTAGLGATYRLPIDNRRTLQVNGAVGRTHYDEPELRYWSATLGAVVIDRQPDQTLRYGASVKRSIYDVNTSSLTDSNDAWRYALTASLSQDRAAGLTRTISGRFEYRDYVEQDARDGAFVQSNVAWSMPAGEKGRLSWGVGLERHTPELAYQQNWGVSGHIGYTQLVTDTTRLGATVSGTFRRYDDIFNTVDFARADDIYKLGFSATDTRIRIFGAVPTVSCNYTDHQSNIALYDTSATDCAVTFSFDF